MVCCRMNAGETKVVRCRRASVRSKPLKEINVGFAEKELVAIQSCAWRVMCSWVHRRCSGIS